MSSAKLSQSQKQKTPSVSLDRGEIERLSNDVVRYLLVMDQKKIPIKKADINKNVLKENGKAFPQVIKEAEHKLRMMFGLELHELEDKFKGTFILVSSLSTSPAEPNDHIKWSEDEERRHGLLMLVLSVIFMSDNIVTDGKLWAALKKFGIDQDLPHEVFGDVKKLVLQEWPRQGYIEVTKQPNIDPPISEVRWGQRAYLETTQRGVLQFVSKIYGVDDIEQWTSQYKQVLDSEKVRQAPATSSQGTQRKQPPSSQRR